MTDCSCYGTDYRRSQLTRPSERDSYLVWRLLADILNTHYERNTVTMLTSVFLKLVQQMHLIGGGVVVMDCKTLLDKNFTKTDSFEISWLNLSKIDAAIIEFTGIRLQSFTY